MINALTMKHKNFLIKISTNFLKILAIVCLCSCCNRPSYVVCVLQIYYYYTCTKSLEINQIQIPRPPEDHHQQKNVENPPTHTFILQSISTPFWKHPSSFFRFLHPLGLLNFDHLNHFRHAYNTYFVSSYQLAHESLWKAC